MTEKNNKSSNLTKETTGFTQVSNNLINDNRISLKAKGLYTYLYSKPNNWQFYQKNILKELKESRKAFDNAIKELENFGWLERIRKKGNDGRFSNYDYHLKTSVRKDTLDKSTSVPFTAVDNSNVEKGTDNNNTYKSNNTYNNKEDKNFIFFKKIIKKYKEPQKIKDSTIEKLYPSLKTKFKKCLKTLGSEDKMEKQIENYLHYILIENYRPKADFEVWINQPAKFLKDWVEKKREFLARRKNYTQKKNKSFQENREDAFFTKLKIEEQNGK